MGFGPTIRVNKLGFQNRCSFWIGRLHPSRQRLEPTSHAASSGIGGGSERAVLGVEAHGVNTAEEEMLFRPLETLRVGFAEGLHGAGRKPWLEVQMPSFEMHPWRFHRSFQGEVVAQAVEQEL